MKRPRWGSRPVDGPGAIQDRPARGPNPVRAPGPGSSAGAFNLVAAFHARAQVERARLALCSEDTGYGYGELATLSSHVAGWLRARDLPSAPRVGVLGVRGAPAIVGILGTCWAGATYVPLNAQQPASRLASLLERAELHALIVDTQGRSLLESGALSFSGEVLDLGRSTDALRLEDCAALASVTPLANPAPVESGHLAYVMFTSGTTGVPKGVMVTAGNVEHFMRVMQERYALTPDDRCSQFFELTFDLSVFDLFMTLGSGASLHVVPERDRMAPGRIIAERDLSVWFSVPSTAAFMDRVKQLTPGAFPSLRLSLFCGEPLPARTAHQWRAAAPNGALENLYGPTEATIACLLEPCTDGVKETPERGTVSIGTPYPGMRAAIVDPERRFVAPGEIGELALAGVQLAAGYWRDEGTTKDRYPTLRHPEHGEERWYLTGDLAFVDADGDFHHLGRVDNQIKLLGHRIELEDVDAHLRPASGSESAAAVPWPVVDGSAQALVGFVAHSELEPSEILRRMRERVPAYMVPRRVVVLDELPLTPNGKLDRKALAAWLDREHAA